MVGGGGVVIGGGGSVVGGGGSVVGGGGSVVGDGSVVGGREMVGGGREKVGSGSVVSGGSCRRDRFGRPPTIEGVQSNVVRHNTKIIEVLEGVILALSTAREGREENRGEGTRFQAPTNTLALPES